MTISESNLQASEKLITHKDSSRSFDIVYFQKALEKKENRFLPLDEEIKLLEELSQFELGRFLLLNKGLNGYWTSYVVLHGLKRNDLHPLEKWILNNAPAIKATQERFRIFQETLQTIIDSNMKIASIPCGLMDDLLTLDYTDIDNISLVGIDLDTKSLELAQENAKKNAIKNVKFLQKDAWELNLYEEFDIITSNGLNIYEKNDSKLVGLYRQFFQSLKKNGILIISFLTPPPSLSKESTWKNVNSEDALKQMAIFSDIIDVTCQAFCTASKMREQLKEAGFRILEISYDSQGMFPAIVAHKK